MPLKIRSRYVRINQVHNSLETRLRAGARTARWPIGVGWCRWNGKGICGACWRIGDRMWLLTALPYRYLPREWGEKR